MIARCDGAASAWTHNGRFPAVQFTVEMDERIEKDSASVILVCTSIKIWNRKLKKMPAIEIVQLDILSQHVFMTWSNMS